MHLDYTAVGALPPVDHHVQSSYLNRHFSNTLNDKCWMFGNEFTGPLVPFCFCSAEARHASKSPPLQSPSYECWYARWRTYRRPWIQNTLHYLLLAERLPVRSALPFSLFQPHSHLLSLFFLFIWCIWLCPTFIKQALHYNNVLMARRTGPAISTHCIKYWWKEHIPHR